VEFTALCGTDNECAPGCFDNVLRDNAEVVNAQDALNLDKKPVQQPKVSSSDAGNRCNGLTIRKIGNVEGQTQFPPMAGQNKVQLITFERPVVMGTTRARPGLDQAMAAVRAGDTLVVPKLDRLARSVPDARDIADTLVQRGVKLAIGASVYDPGDPMGKMFFNILATFAGFEADLIRMRTREGMAIARAKGKLRGKKPKLSEKQQRELRRMHDTGDYSISDLAELFSVSRPTVYRTLSRIPNTA
jgi:DNA invertase Pin-like site-specific DNA recombinase